MFRNIFLKTLYTKRWMTLAWSLGLAAFVILTMLIFPTFKEVGQSFKDVPDSLKSFLGDAEAYSTIAGFADVQVVTQYVFMTLILGIVLFTGLLAGEEGNGTLQTLLVQPVRRVRVYVEKLLAGMAVLLMVCAAITFSIVLGGALVGESVSLGRILEATLAMWLITMVFSSWSYALGAAFGRRGLVGGLAGVLAFASFMITSLAEGVKSLRTADNFSPFHYYNKPGILAHGVDWGDLAVLAILIALPLIAAAYVFVKRDVNQR
jgi:ABC-2 type transport system permease protein